MSLVIRRQRKLQLVVLLLLLSSLELPEQSRLDGKQNESTLMAVARQPATNGATGGGVNKIILSGSIAAQLSKWEDKRDISESFQWKEVWVPCSFCWKH